MQTKLSTIKYLAEDTVDADLNFGCAILLYGSENDDGKDATDLQLDNLFDMFNQMMQVQEDDKNWRTYRKIFISLNAKIKFDFSEGVKELNIPFKDEVEGFARQFGFGDQMDQFKIPKLSDVMPFVFAKILDFDPQVRDVKIFKEDKELFGEMADEAQ